MFLTFAVMKDKLPIKNLVQLNWLLAVVIGAIVLLFLLLANGDAKIPLTLSALSAGIVFIDGTINLQILKMIKRSTSKNGTWKNCGWYILSYLLSAVSYLAALRFFGRLQISWSSFQAVSILLLVSALVNTLVLLLHRFLMLLHGKARADHELSLIKIAHAEAANLLLKQQVHPHFLFNSLSSVKALYSDDPAAGERYILHLANFLRASVSSHTDKVSSLQQEMAILKDYMEMQHIRFGDALHYCIDIHGDSMQKYSLPSFSLQPLVENAIKHNDLTEERPLSISITQKGDRIVVSNYLQRKAHPELSSGKGLANLADRYRLLSNDELEIKETANLFSVSLKLLTK